VDVLGFPTRTERRKIQRSHPLETRSKRLIPHDDSVREVFLTDVTTTKEEIVARGNRFEQGEGWARVKALIELAKRDDEREWTKEEREQTFRRILARVQRGESPRSGDPWMALSPSS
jgi:hypothetical protein